MQTGSSSNSSHSCHSHTQRLNIAIPTTPVTPSTPDSAGILIGAAGQAVHDKRNKTIMHYFRDRTPSHTRAQQQQYINNSNYNREQKVGFSRKRQETRVYLKEPPRSAINKLALLSTSMRDLSRLTIDEKTPDIIAPTANVHFDSSTNSSAASGMSNESSAAEQRKRQRGQRDSLKYCEGYCARRITELEQRVSQLEQQVQNERTVAKDLSTRIQELIRRVEDLSLLKAPEKRKLTSFRRKNVQTNATNTQPSVQPSKLVTWMNLSNWFKQRPTIATLKEQNIYNDEPCFDTEIEMVLKHEIHKTVPKIVVDCCDLIDERYRNSTEPIEGIYRQCGDYNKIQTLRFRIDANDYASLRQANIDIYTLTGVLKLFLREIKHPLVSANEAKTFIGQPNQWLLTDLTAKIEILKRLIRTLPEVNRDTMSYIFAHFNKLTKVPLQQISADTLAISISPTIFHPVQKGANTQDLKEIIKEGQLLADCVKIMIEYHSRIFECPVERRHKRISVRRLRKTLSQPDLFFQNLF
ncbi:rho GTPase-activating protein 12 isoform X1 [Ceratitis capitata]|uniref:rho GTPase-activating protein 12 isoform X1 n=1 Tax=Ceratitis capitata TaxID=7213 RepID=UPI00032A1BC5|nr:rho GTPase-activating protein 12 isoform X1 [Ceratitis capitata]